MKKRYSLVALALSGALLLGCDENPTIPDISEDLHGELEFSAEHLSTLTDIEFEVRVHSSSGGTYTDFSSIALEFRLDGEVEWSPSDDLTLHEDHFAVEMMFFTSGEYEARVVAQLPGSTGVLVLYQSTEHLHVERIHQEVGDYIVEFETTPGHLHEGATIEATFWVLEASTDGHGHGHGIEGLVPEIVCTENALTSERHAAHDHMEGEYGAEHTILEAGDIVFEIHFTDPNDATVDHHATFSAPVSHEH